METLFKAITRGIYPKIPSHYSSDLNDMIRMMLQTNPILRPTSEKLLNCSIMKKKIKSMENELNSI
jgi:NIMA (never in mitosis gene a)-related kinase